MRRCRGACHQCYVISTVLFAFFLVIYSINQGTGTCYLFPSQSNCGITIDTRDSRNGHSLTSQSYKEILHDVNKQEKVKSTISSSLKEKQSLIREHNVKNPTLVNHQRISNGVEIKVNHNLNTELNTNLNTDLTGFDFNFRLPWSDSMEKAYRYQNTHWIQFLTKFTKKVNPSEPILIACADIKFKEALLNWLISVLVLQKEPPKNILIVTSRASICSLLERHDLSIDCLTLSANDIIFKWKHKLRNGRPVKASAFQELLVIRLSVMRVLNHMGYDVINMDSDAIMLKNPIPVLESYKDSDVVGTFGGSLPHGLFRRWGVVVCMGAILIRSTPKTGTTARANKEQIHRETSK